MKIIKYKKKSKDKYEVLLEDGKKITLYEDVIVSNNLLFNKNISNDLLNKIIKENNDLDAYFISLNYICIKMRSTYEIKTYLNKKKYNSLVINKTINMLTKNGYLNDVNFTKAFISDQINLTNNGPLKIRKELLAHKIDEKVIDKELSKVDNNLIKEKLIKLMNKQLKIKKGSSNMLKAKLTNYFINLGYEKDMIANELSKVQIKTDDNVLKKECEKLYNKYKNKYDNGKLIYFICQKLYSKGYTSDDINKVIKTYTN